MSGAPMSHPAQTSRRRRTIFLNEKTRRFCTQDLRSVRDLEAFLHAFGFSRADALEIASRFVGKASRHIAAADIRTSADLASALRDAGYSQTQAHAIAARFNPRA